MKKFLRAACVGLGALAAFVGASVWAQVPGYSLNPGNRPAVNPMINLLRPGSNRAISYYGIVRPEVGFSSALQQLQQQEAALAQGQQDLTSAVLPPTGHATGFMTQSRFFMTKGTRGTVAQPIQPMQAGPVGPAPKSPSRR